MKTGIIGAMDPEVELLLSRLENKKITKFGFCEYAEGYLEGKEVVISRSGIGKVCASATAAVMLANFKPDYIINTGSAGGIGAGLNLGDIVLSEQAGYHDADLRIFGYKLGQMAGHEPYFKADPKLIDAAEQAIKSLNDFTGKVVKGTVLSGDQFISDPAKKQFFQQNFDKAMVAEMEGAAIAQVASDFKVPFLIIRAVSDSAEEGNSMTYAEFLPLAAKNSAEMVLALLRIL